MHTNSLTRTTHVQVEVEEEKSFFKQKIRLFVFAWRIASRALCQQQIHHTAANIDWHSHDLDSL